MINLERDEIQDELLKILFEPLTLNNLNSPRDIVWIRESAELIAEKFLIGELDLDEDWEFEKDDLSEVKALSFQWLKYARKFYSDIVSNEQESGFNLLKFVWHKKQQELDGWGPKLVIAAHNREEETTTIHYVTRKMDREKASNVANVGTMFNLFQPPQQQKPHKVNVKLTEHATIFTTQMESGRTLHEHFQELYERFTENENNAIIQIEQVFEHMINLYLQPTIEYQASDVLTKLPSLGLVKPCSYQWKYLDFQEGYLFKHLLDNEQQTPFLIPVRWVFNDKKDELEPISILHGDEWGGNFISPTSISGSLRPIDFEDAHVQFLNNDFIVSEKDYCTKIESTNGHFTAGGRLAYRTQETPTNTELPLHRYCAFSALGRLLCSLIQRQSRAISSDNTQRWIEITVSKFFCVLEDCINKAINNTMFFDDDDSTSIEEIHKGFMFRTLLSAWNWSEHWKSKPRAEQSQDFIGKWRNDWLNYFQGQLLTEGLWQYMDKDHKGRPSSQPSFYSHILKSLDDGKLSESEKEDILNAIRFVEQHWYEPRITQGFAHFDEFVDLYEDVNWQENYGALSDLEMNIMFINVMHQLGSHELYLEKEEDKNNITTFLIELLSRPTIREGILDSGYEKQSYWFLFIDIHEIREALEQILPLQEINPLKINNFDSYFGIFGNQITKTMQEEKKAPTGMMLYVLVELESLSERMKIGNIDDSVFYQHLNNLTNVWLRNIYFQEIIIDDIRERGDLLTILIETPSLDLEKDKIQEPLWLLDKIFFTILQERDFFTNNPNDEHYLSVEVISTIGTAMNTFFQMYHQSRGWRNNQERVEMAQKRISEILMSMEVLFHIRPEWRNVIVDVWNQNHKVWEKRKYIQNEVWAAQWRELFLSFNG